MRGLRLAAGVTTILAAAAGCEAGSGKSDAAFGQMRGALTSVLVGCGNSNVVVINDSNVVCEAPGHKLELYGKDKQNGEWTDNGVLATDRDEPAYNPVTGKLRTLGNGTPIASGDLPVQDCTIDTATVSLKDCTDVKKPGGETVKIGVGGNLTFINGKYVDTAVGTTFNEATGEWDWLPTPVLDGCDSEQSGGKLKRGHIVGSPDGQIGGVCDNIAKNKTYVQQLTQKTEGNFAQLVGTANAKGPCGDLGTYSYARIADIEFASCSDGKLHIVDNTPVQPVDDATGGDAPDAPDGGPVDADQVDADPADAGTVDAPDAADGGPADVDPADAGTVDAPDAPDGGPAPDADPGDAGPTDTGKPVDTNKPPVDAGPTVADICAELGIKLQKGDCSVREVNGECVVVVGGTRGECAIIFKDGSTLFSAPPTGEEMGFVSRQPLPTAAKEVTTVGLRGTGQRANLQGPQARVTQGQGAVSVIGANGKALQGTQVEALEGGSARITAGANDNVVAYPACDGVAGEKVELAPGESNTVNPCPTTTGEDTGKHADAGPAVTNQPGGDGGGACNAGRGSGKGILALLGLTGLAAFYRRVTSRRKVTA